MAFPDSFLQDLASRNDIESVVGAYVQLKRRGRIAVGLCPFHGEKTPSFTVYPETASFYCFGCGCGGDVITFIKKIENLDYVDAVKFLADRAGLKLPEDRRDDASSRLRLRILEANREAARYFHATLYSPAGREGLDYYHRRGYTDHTIRRFGLGYAPQGWTGLVDHLRGKGFRDEELTAAFLAARSRKSSGNVYDIFRHRVMVPIIDIRGNVIAFGGRVLDDSKPKYLNTSDTLVFKKTNTLFALNFAKASKEEHLILCEGYMDVIALHQAGFPNAVAALGTSFTSEHARLLARYTKEAVLVFDADAAGKKAAARAIPLLRQAGLHVRVITIPDGKDPDEFIQRNGAERFKLLVNRSANDVEYQLLELARQYALDTADGKVAYLRQAAGVLAKLSSPIERDVYAGKLAQELNVRKEALLDQVERLMATRHKQQQKKELSQAVRHSEEGVRKANPDAVAHPRAARAEEGLLGLVLLHPDYLPAVAEVLPPTQMVTAFNRRVYAQLLDRQRQGLLTELTLLSADYEDVEMAYLSHMIQRAREGAQTPAQVLAYAHIVAQEQRRAGWSDPAALSAEEIQDVLNALREQQTRKEEHP